MNIIFLDVDGVLNSWRNILAFGRMPWPNTFDMPSSPYESTANEFRGPESELDPLAIGMIRKLCELTDAKIVLHSMWRNHVDPVDFGKRHRLPVIDKTHPHADKATGIYTWLHAHPNEIENIAIIDDDKILDRLNAFPGDGIADKMHASFIQIDLMNGFTYMDFANAFLALTDGDIDEIREKNEKVEQLRSRFLMIGKDDEESRIQRIEDEKELTRLSAEFSDAGTWSVTEMIRRIG